MAIDRSLCKHSAFFIISYRECFISYHQSLQSKVDVVDKETQTGECVLTPSKERGSVRQMSKGNIDSLNYDPYRYEVCEQTFFFDLLRHGYKLIFMTDTEIIFNI